MRDLVLIVGLTVNVEGGRFGSEYCGFAAGYIELRIGDASGVLLVKRLSIDLGSQAVCAWSGESAAE